LEIEGEITMKLNKTYVILVIPVLIALVAIIVLVSKNSGKEEDIVTGMTECTTVDVSSKIAGRLDSVCVSEGDMVTKGQIIGHLESKELDAKVEQARGMMEAAKSKVDMARNGARPEEIEATQKLYQQAQHQYELAEKTYNRIVSLYNDKVISAQEKDQVEFQYKAAKEQMEAAKAKYTMVKKGARSEEKTGADALYYSAQNQYNEAGAYHKDLTLRSPINGELSSRVCDPGEVIGAGYPIFTVTDLNDCWVVLQISEDKMSKIKKDAHFYGTVPALGNQKFEFRVSYIAAMADYANWKPTNQKGDYDIKTFEVRLRAVNKIEGLRSGMSVHVTL
jgi:HlyD family secretion protein